MLPCSHEWIESTRLLIKHIAKVHELIDSQSNRKYFSSKYAFRLIYDGKVVTKQMEGCLDDAELCDMAVLTTLVDKFATRERDCKPEKGGFVSF